MRATPANTLRLILLAGALGAGCGKKGNTETNNPGAANRPEAETPKLPPTKPEVADISKTLPLPSRPVPAAPKTLPPALVAAREKAGFQAKWKGPDKESGKIIVSDDLEKLDVSKTVLRFEPRPNDFGEASVVLKSLPAPAMSFGLDLSRTEISDVDLKELVQIQQLTSLRINDCLQITDEGLKEVAKLQHLNSVHVGGPFSKITDAAMTELKKALPNCKINR